jgi:hypothetical protein
MSEAAKHGGRAPGNSDHGEFALHRSTTTPMGIPRHQRATPRLFTAQPVSPWNGSLIKIGFVQWPSSTQRQIDLRYSSVRGRPEIQGGCVVAHGLRRRQLFPFPHENRISVSPSCISAATQIASISSLRGAVP